MKDDNTDNNVIKQEDIVKEDSTVKNKKICCNVTLKYGKRKGDKCNVKAFKNNMCKRHYNLKKT